ncbi:MAG: TauD/TfdA family dioxygenase [Acidimicrobiales bacterium]
MSSRISLADDVDAELFELLNAALLDWKVLFFRHQDITNEQHLRFAANWGDVESHPFFSVLHPDELFGPGGAFRRARTSRATEHGTTMSRGERASLGSVRRPSEVPAAGGGTLWADIRAGYTTASPRRP